MWLLTVALLTTACSLELQGLKERRLAKPAHAATPSETQVTAPKPQQAEPRIHLEQRDTNGTWHQTREKFGWYPTCSRLHKHIKYGPKTSQDETKTSFYLNDKVHPNKCNTGTEPTTGNLPEVCTDGKVTYDTDHLVSIREAVDSGLDPAHWDAFGDYPYNLVFAESCLNQHYKKGHDPHEWWQNAGNKLPRRTDEGQNRNGEKHWVISQTRWENYLKCHTSVKLHWKMSFDEEEHSFLLKQLGAASSTELTELVGTPETACDAENRDNTPT